MEYREDDEGVCVVFRERPNRELARLRVDRVINCTGPDCDFRNVDSALVADLLRNKQTRVDELSLGLNVTESGAVIDGYGRCSDWLYAAGPLCKGRLWETIAAPELRVQVADLARLLVAQATAELDKYEAAAD